jgi:hypothetical protein
MNKAIYRNESLNAWGLSPLELNELESMLVVGATCASTDTNTNGITIKQTRTANDMI